MSTEDSMPERDEERPVDGEGELVLPDRLDAPLDATEADVIDQAIAVPPDDEEG